MTAPKLTCPKCGKGDLRRCASARGKTRYRHPDFDKPGACTWHGTDPIGLVEDQTRGLDKAAAKALHRKIRGAKGTQRYVITAAQNATPVNEPFFKALKQYCAHTGAELLVIPYRYKNPTSMWTAKAQDEDWWDPKLAPHMLSTRTPVGKHVVILGDIMTQPTAERPLQGFETLVGGKSAIIGHPKLELITVPAPQSKRPTLLTTTGSVTVKNYIPAKAGKKAEHHHTFGACVLEVNGNAYHIRQLNAVKDGSFMDLEHEYTENGYHRHDGIDSIFLGDTHFEFVSKEAVEATFGKNGIVPTLKPKHLVWNDLHDFYSRSHHHAGRPFVNYAKHLAEADDVRLMLKLTFEFLDRYTQEGALNVIVKSNHHDHLAQWLDRADWKTDLVNAEFILETQLEMVRAARLTRHGTETIDPFVMWGRRLIKKPDHTLFLGPGVPFIRHGVDLSHHGHAGVNGARGSRAGFSRIGVKTFIAHGHAPGIRDGCYQVGSMREKADYEQGPSSHLHTHGLLYANGKRCLINMIGTKWRAR